MSFIDEARIFVKAGDGGKGCESYYKDKLTRYARPDGGDGGNGGDVCFVADTHVQTLLDFKFKQHYKAKRGGHGSSKGKKGKTGADCVLLVPVGTVIRDKDTGLLIRDLTQAGDQVVAAAGGRGGRGNINRRTPAPPQPGEERTVHLELKIMADVGLVGFPNAGKSTLISNISKVRSKIAGYPFTTKQPVLGVVHTEDLDFVVADLPGLIERAHEGRGLGDRFLKHAERTRILVQVIDMAATEGRDPLEDYTKIGHELREYGGEVAQKTRILVANKMDLPDAAGHLARFRRAFADDILPVSAVSGEGLDALVERLGHLLADKAA